MPRICSREGCGRPLLKKDRTPDYRRHFCTGTCKNADKRERMRAKRALAANGRCPTCGRGPSAMPFVPRHEIPRERDRSPGEPPPQQARCDASKAGFLTRTPSVEDSKSFEK